MKALKITLNTLSLLMLIVCFTTAAPMVQKKTLPSDETTDQVVSPSKPDKKLNLIEKFILKKMQKKIKKVDNEDKYRKWSIWSVILGALAVPVSLIIFGIANLIISNNIGVILSSGVILITDILLALTLIVFFMSAIMAIIFGVIAEKNTKNEKTRKMARIGKIIGITLLILSLGSYLGLYIVLGPP